MLAQGEHGDGSLVDGDLTVGPRARRAGHALERLVVERPTVADAACALVHVCDARAAIELANAIAPEHLQLIGSEPEALARDGALRRLRVRRRQCQATAFGDYVAGSNHVLPTDGSARFGSTLSPRHFRRRMSEVRLGPLGGETVRKLAAAGAPIARAEGFRGARRVDAGPRADPAAESTVADDA